MSAEPIAAPSSSRLRLLAMLAFMIAGAILARGLDERANARKDLVRWTDAQAVPPVALAQIEKGPAFRTLSLPGTIQPYNRAAIHARVSGYLKSWGPDIGAHVAAGQLLASIDAPDLDQQLQQAKADLASAEANEQLAVLTAKRWRALVASQSVAQQVVDEKEGDAAAKKALADAAQANVRRLEALEAFKSIVAPFDGVITVRKTDIGALIDAGSGSGQELYEISDLHRVRIYVQVPQAFTAQLRPGLKAHFELPQYPGGQFEATLVTTSNAVEAGSRSMLVELQAENPDGALSAGTYCNVHFEIPGDPNVLRLPATALVPDDQGPEVAVVGPGDKAVMTRVKLGRDFGDTVEVTSGLGAADRVIDSPAETLQTGDIVRLAATPGTAAQAKAN